jgi:Peptidase family M48
VRAASLLYLICLPLIIVLSLLGTLLFIAVCLVARRIPIGVIASTFEGLGKTIGVLMQRTRARVRPPKRVETGRLIAPAEAPRLFLALDIVSKLADAPLPHEVRMVPESTVSVHERSDEGSDETVRVLTVGAAALQDLDLQSFLAILAHELGHLRSGDTSGGVHAIRVSNNMMHLASALPGGMYTAMVVRLLRPVWWMHHRITRSAQRFQEVMADRVAVAAFGAAAFEDGLTQIVVNGVVFDTLVNGTMKDPKQRTLSVYDESRLSPAQIAALEQRATDQLGRKTSSYDSHPSPHDRFRYAKVVTSAATQNVPGEAWSLFLDPNGLRKQMDARIRADLGIGPVEIAPIYTYEPEPSVRYDDEYVPVSAPAEPGWTRPEPEQQRAANPAPVWVSAGAPR